MADVSKAAKPKESFLLLFPTILLWALAKQKGQLSSKETPFSHQSNLYHLTL